MFRRVFTSVRHVGFQGFFAPDDAPGASIDGGAIHASGTVDIVALSRGDWRTFVVRAQRGT
ncbi:MAG: hypothetical protein QOF76_1866 [Solirubrobacteraceae bacterium]|nr:hypothetical protein [Solirubrobacteraceae bacterium]